MREPGLFVRSGLLVALFVGGAPRAASAQDEGGVPGEAPPQEDPAAAQQRGADAAAQLVEIFRREPPVREIQDAALKYFRVNPEKVSSLRSGARLKGLLPELEVFFNNELGNANRIMQDGLFVNLPFKENENSQNDRVAWGLRAVWGLDRLAFNPEELDVASLIGVQEGLLREVTTLYYTRRRLQVGMVLNPPQDDAEMITEALRLEEATATLDALTGGFLSKKLKQASEPQRRSEKKGRAQGG